MTNSNLESLREKKLRKEEQWKKLREKSMNGQDKKDFETAAKFLDKGDLRGFNKFIHTLDSFPRDEILHSAGLWNTKLPESMSYVGKDVSQKLSYDNWLKKVKGVEKGAHGIKGDEHTKLSKQWRDYKKEEVELEEGRMKELHTLIQQGKSAEEIAKIMKLDVKTVQALMPKEEVNEVSPPGWGGSVKAMKKHADIDNPYALAWHMKNKGDKPHYKDKDGPPVKKDKYKDEQMTEDINILTTFIAFLTTFTVSYFSISIFIKLVKQLGYMPFIIYRLILGCILLWLI